MGRVAELFLDPQSGVRKETAQTGWNNLVVAELLEPPSGGMARVRFGDTTEMEARCTLDVCRAGVAGQWHPGQEVLVVFENSDLERPIAIALMAAVDSNEPLILPVEEGRPAVAEVDGEKVIIRGEQRVELRCGKASIVIRNDGKVIIRGTHLLSQSSGAIRLKGGHVDIN